MISVHICIKLNKETAAKDAHSNNCIKILKYSLKTRTISYKYMRCNF